LESEQLEINDVVAFIFLKHFENDFSLLSYFLQGTPLAPLLEHGHQETPWFVSGTVETQKRHSFERVLWRACRRTAFVRTAEIDADFHDPDTVRILLK
jgi:hypothetical protein